MECTRYQTDGMRFLDGELTEAEKSEYESHVRQCDDCGRELASLGRVVDLTNELRLRARWLISLKVAQDGIKAHEKELEQTVFVRTQELRDALAEVQAARLMTHQAHMDTIHRLTIAGEYKDRDTAHHVERIGMFSAVVARGRRTIEV